MMRKYWFINGEQVLPFDEINPNTKRRYNAGEVLDKFANHGMNRLAVMFVKE